MQAFQYMCVILLLLLQIVFQIVGSEIFLKNLSMAYVICSIYVTLNNFWFDQNLHHIF